eukprot:XP_001706937.1 Hypothetical protein GL50803_92990 [Giardia lamblia ATCC 50803]
MHNGCRVKQGPYFCLKDIEQNLLCGGEKRCSTGIPFGTRITICYGMRTIQMAKQVQGVNISFRLPYGQANVNYGTNIDHFVCHYMTK